MKGTIHNKDSFLSNISKNLNRAMPHKVDIPKWTYRPQDKTLTGLTQDELLDVLKQQCEFIHTDLVVTNSKDVNQTLTAIIAKYGNGEVIATNDTRYAELGIDLSQHNAFIWDEAKGAENLHVAERANVGITISEKTLAESGTVVLYADKGIGRSVSLLPATYIAIVPKSTIVPRFTQAAQEMNQMMKEARDFPTCINLITGPSNSADIEMKLVVGVHGPIKATYIVIDDK
ncbi:LutC/YkgG family protein [Macrococcoides caseolyticum]|uniref:LutC/YkgG family protein n=1 Tax=Macrococcoides caseolyticum TaxID=69966 RepID=UPI002279C65B|nr:lactate utilization protein C [Macrococcus caseolyticus]